MKPPRAVVLTLASVAALVAAVWLAGPHRLLRVGQCALDRVQHGGAVRELDGVQVRLPSSWWELARDNPRGTSELRVARVPRSRWRHEPVAIVRHVNFDLSRDKAEAAFTTLGWESLEYGSWEPAEIVDVDLGGRPGYEIRYERLIAGPGGIDDVSADFLLPEQHLWVQCSPMSEDDLAQCREIAASASAH